MATTWTTPRKRADGEIVPRNVLQEQYVDNATHLKEHLPEIGADFDTGSGSIGGSWTDFGAASVTITLDRTADVLCFALAKLYPASSVDAEYELRISNDTDGDTGLTSGLFGGDQWCRRQIGIIGYFADVSSGSKTFKVQAQYDWIPGKLYHVVLIVLGIYT